MLVGTLLLSERAATASTAREAIMTTAKPYTFDVMSPSGYNDGPVTVLAADYHAAADLAAAKVAERGSGEVLDVMDNIIVIADE
jgi:hypothetical protein